MKRRRVNRRRGSNPMSSGSKSFLRSVIKKQPRFAKGTVLKGVNVGGRIIPKKIRAKVTTTGKLKKGARLADIPRPKGKAAKRTKKRTVKRTTARKVARKRPVRRRVARKRPVRRRVARKRTTARKVARKRTTAKKTRPGYVWVKGHTRKGGKKIKGHWMKKPRKRVRKANPRRRVRRRRTTALARRPRRRAIARRRNPRRRRAITRRRRRRLSRNPLGKFLGTKTAWKRAAIKATWGAAGFGTTILISRLITRSAFVQANIMPTTGAWTAVLANVATLGAMTLAKKKLKITRKLDMNTMIFGGGIATALNVLNLLIAQRIIPPEIARWLAPWAEAAPTAVAAANGMTEAEAAVSGLGVDVYERALSGGVESALESQLNSMSGAGSGGVAGGIFDQPSVLGEYEEIAPYGTTAEQAVAAYEATPLSAYESVPMGTTVRQATGMYGMGAEVEEAFADYESVPLGATVEQAMAGLGQEGLLQQIATATRRITQRRIAAGLPVDPAFLQQIGQAAANLARQRSAVASRPAGALGPAVPTARAVSPLTRMGAPTYGSMVEAVQSGGGMPAPIPAMSGDEGIFGGGNGIF